MKHQFSPGCDCRACEEERASIKWMMAFDSWISACEQGDYSKPNPFHPKGVSRSQIKAMIDARFPCKKLREV